MVANTALRELLGLLQSVVARNSTRLLVVEKISHLIACENMPKDIIHMKKRMKIVKYFITDDLSCVSTLRPDIRDTCQLSHSSRLSTLFNGSPKRNRIHVNFTSDIGGLPYLINEVQGREYFWLYCRHSFQVQL